MLNQCTQRPACPHRVGHAACSSQSSPGLLSASMASGDQFFLPNPSLWLAAADQPACMMEKTDKKKLGEWNRETGWKSLVTVTKAPACVWRLTAMAWMMSEAASAFLDREFAQVLQVLENVELFAFVRLFPILSHRYISEGKYLNQTKQKIFSVDLGKVNGRFINIYIKKKCC